MSDVSTPFELVRAAAQTSPKRLAIVSPTMRLNYGQLYMLGTQLGQMLRRRGVKPGDIVGVHLKSLWRCVFSVAASHEALVTVPLSKALLDDNYIGMTWLAVEKAVPGFPIEQQIIIDRETVSRLRSIEVTAAPREYASNDALFRIAMSSGTTGRSKAIGLSVSHNHERALESIGRWATDGLFMSFMYPKNGVGWHAWHASLVRKQPYFVPTGAIENVQMMAGAGIESVMGSPSHLGYFVQALELTGIKLPKLRAIQSGGSRLTSALASRIRDLTGIEVGNTYSSTELGAVAYRNAESDDHNYMGELDPTMEVEIVDPDTNLAVDPGEFGVIRLRRPGMISGYMFNDEATAEQFRDGWFYPGDIARIDGTSLYLGARDSEIINAGGLKVDPTVIDTALLENASIKDAATFAYRDELDVDHVAAAYVADADFDIDVLRNAMTAAMGKSAPEHYFPIDAVPRNEWGKILRAELTERFSVTKPE